MISPPGPVASETSMPSMELELHRIDLKYAHLGVIDPKQDARLVASIAEIGQQSPVFVVPCEAPRYVLVDGYRRTKAMRKLHHDTVQALVLPMDEADALLLKHQMKRVHRRSAFEDAWLLRELLETHGLKQYELARKLQRSRSWVCRRLSLITDVPVKAQELVRRGKMFPQAAMKYLVPLSRDNRKACEELAKNLSGERVTVRQMGQLYAAWRTGDAEQKQRIVEMPLLFFKAREELRRPDPPAPSKNEYEALLRDLGSIIHISNRARHRIRQGVLKGRPFSQKFEQTWQAASQSLEALASLLERARLNA